MVERSSQTRRVKWLVIALLGVTVFACATFGVALYLKQQNTEQLRKDFVTGCETSGNTIRGILTHRSEGEEARDKLKLLKEIFPGLPPGHLYALVTLAKVRDRQEIAELAPINCAEKYPGP